MNINPTSGNMYTNQFITPVPKKNDDSNTDNNDNQQAQQRQFGMQLPGIETFKPLVDAIQDHHIDARYIPSFRF